MIRDLLNEQELSGIYESPDDIADRFRFDRDLLFIAHVFFGFGAHTGLGSGLLGGGGIAGQDTEEDLIDLVSLGSFSHRNIPDKVSLWTGENFVGDGSIEERHDLRRRTGCELVLDQLLVGLAEHAQEM